MQGLVASNARCDSVRRSSCARVGVPAAPGNCSGLLRLLGLSKVLVW